MNNCYFYRNMYLYFFCEIVKNSYHDKIMLTIITNNNSQTSKSKIVR